jgi:subtilisin family serine protease
MDRVLKVLATGSQQAELANEFQVLERYPAFVLLDARADAISELEARGYAVVDLTDRYAIPGNRDTIDTSQPRLDSRGEHRHRAYEDTEALPGSPHHYLVQFNGPIKAAWLQGIEDAGGEPRALYSDFTYVVRANRQAINRIVKLSYVRWMGHLRHADRVSPTVFRRENEPADPAGRVRQLEGTYTIEFFGRRETAAATAAVRRLGFDILAQEPEAGTLVVQARPGGDPDPRQIEELARVHGVRKVRPRTVARFSDAVAAALMGVDSVGHPPQGVAGNLALGDSIPAGDALDGAGESVAVCDSGLDTGDRRTMHPDFVGRVAYLKSYPVSKEFDDRARNPRANDGPADRGSGHGTHVAGAILGDGKASKGPCGLAVNGGVCAIPTPVRGLAPRAKLVFQAVEQEVRWKSEGDLLTRGNWGPFGLPVNIYPLLEDAYRAGARIHTNAWSNGLPGDYDGLCERLDEFVWDHEGFCILVAAGNDAVDRGGTGQVSLGGIAPPATAKNCITVGASESRRPEFDFDTYGRWWPQRFPALEQEPMADDGDQVVAFSARGPTLDQRRKPDLVAPGTFILSTRSTVMPGNNKAWFAYPECERYVYMGGTSQAVALAAGAVALLRQHLRTREGIRRPTAALLKAALIVGAVWLGERPSSGVLFDPGQGYGRLNLANLVAPAAPATVRFADERRGLHENQKHRPIRVRVESGRVPLRVVLAYSDYFGAGLVNHLNLVVTRPDGREYGGNQPLSDSRSRDDRNNVEVIEIPDPPPGTWTIRVEAGQVPQAPQRFALAYRGHLANGA